jgi:hypothetical protein
MNGHVNAVSNEVFRTLARTVSAKRQNIFTMLPPKL